MFQDYFAIFRYKEEKITRVGQLVFELKTNYIQFFNEDTHVKLLQVNGIFYQLAQ